MLRVPAQPVAILGRVAALLSPYYTSDVSEGIRRMEAEDWLEALRKYPEWAIIRACRWWKSEHNDKRRQKPIEGDIAARASREMGVVAVANMAIRRFDNGDDPWVPARQVEQQRCTPEAAAEIMAKAGIALKGMRDAK